MHLAEQACPLDNFQATRRIFFNLMRKILRKIALKLHAKLSDFFSLGMSLRKKNLESRSGFFSTHFRLTQAKITDKLKYPAILE